MTQTTAQNLQHSGSSASRQNHAKKRKEPRVEVSLDEVEAALEEGFAKFNHLRKPKVDGYVDSTSSTSGAKSGDGGFGPDTK